MNTGFQPATPADMRPLSQISFTPSHIGTDPAAYLPPAAAHRFRTLKQHADDLHKLMPEFSERQEAHTAKMQAEQTLKRLQDRASVGGFELPDNDPRCRGEKAKLDALAAECKRLDGIYQARSEAWRVASQTVAAVTAYLLDGRPAGTVLEDFNGPKPTLNKGEDVLSALDRTRRRGRELRAGLHTIQSAPFPSTYAKQRMREQIEALAARGAPSVSRLVEHDTAVEFADELHSVPVIAGDKQAPVATVVTWEQPDALALFAWTFKEALIAKLDGEIDAESDDAASLSHEARQKQEAEVLSDLLAVERDECFWLFEAMAKNLPVSLRVDVDPLALLGLQLRTATPSNPSPGTTGGHAYDLVGLLRR